MKQCPICKQTLELHTIASDSEWGEKPRWVKAFYCAKCRRIFYREDLKNAKIKN